MFRYLSTFSLAAFLPLFCAVAFAQTTDTSIPASGAAKVIFYRSGDDGGKAYALTSQNQTLAKLKKGEKFEQTLTPGTYYYMADPSTKQVFKLEVSAGQTVYVKAGRNDDFFDGQPTLQITNAQSYQQALANID
ncbi:MAG: hypothetical protein ABI644_08205 [Arenimonas sp.]